MMCEGFSIGKPIMLYIQYDEDKYYCWFIDVIGILCNCGLE